MLRSINGAFVEDATSSLDLLDPSAGLGTHETSPVAWEINVIFLAFKRFSAGSREESRSKSTYALLGPLNLRSVRSTGPTPDLFLILMHDPLITKPV